MKQYINILWEQFCNRKGIRLDNKDYEDDFMNWIIENKLLLENYKKFLESIGIVLEEDDVLEIGKGKYDSLESPVIRSISPFKKEKSYLVVEQGLPLIITRDNISIPQERLLLTHNPYFESEILSWHRIHNRGEKNISIGMFGKITDEDALRKYQLLEELSHQMTDDYTFDYSTDKDDYYVSLNSKRKVLLKRHVL